MAIGKGDWRLKGKKRHFYLQEVENKDTRNSSSEPHLDPWEGDEAANPGKHFEACEGQEGPSGVLGVDAPRGSCAWPIY